MRRFRFLAALTMVVLVLGIPADGQRNRKEEEPPTQVLELPKDLPNLITAETDRLVFAISPLVTSGLLSRQVREALKSLNRQLKGATVVALRAFVAGTGDMRRVQSIVSETFTERRQPLPVLTVVHSGGLPATGAQVVLEAIAVARKAVNPNGLVFVSGQRATSTDPLDPMGPLSERSLAVLSDTLKSTGVEAGDVQRATCFVSLIDGSEPLRQKLAAAYPKAALNVVQLRREPTGSVVECEAVAHLGKASPERIQRSSNIVLLNAPRVAITGAQLAFRSQESDIKLAFERLNKTLEEAGAGTGDVSLRRVYALSRTVADRVLQIEREYFNKQDPPGGSVLLFEALPSLDASFAIDAVAELNK